MSTAQPPNILFIHVDELRYPMHFPKGIDTAARFMERFMPNVHRHLWQGGVVFSRHYTAAADCSAARGTFVTGLYAQQTNLMIVRGTQRTNPHEVRIEAPPLDPVFPTYGKLLRTRGYDTPYIGKWHLSDAPATDLHSYLQNYGFEGLTIPDPNGVAGQGIGKGVSSDGEKVIGDRDIALRAMEWLKNRAKPGAPTTPFCLTVGFINPHDKQWFWNGPEGKTFCDVFTEYGATQFSGALEQLVESLPPSKDPPANIAGEADPPHYGYHMPDNWQSKEQMGAAGSPTLVPVFSGLTDFTCGAISDDPREIHFTTASNVLSEGWTAAVAPHSYWTRALDMYTQAMAHVDHEIGILLDNIPAALMENLIIVFTSDHGEYASSHGLQGKGFTGYEETINVPLIVRDYTGQFATPGVRDRLTSHVDLLRMLVGFGYGGDSWITGDYELMYGGRADLLNLLKNPTAEGRPFAAYTCDEVFLPLAINPGDAPTHVTALILPSGKFTFFAHWEDGTPAVAETYYYDRTAREGRLELESSTPPPSIGPDAAWALALAEVRGLLPSQYRDAQIETLAKYGLYRDVIAAGAAAAVWLTNQPASTPPPPSPPVYLPVVNAP